MDGAKKMFVAMVIVCIILIRLAYYHYREDGVHLNTTPAPSVQIKCPDSDQRAVFLDDLDHLVNESTWVKIRILRDALFRAYSHPLPVAKNLTCKGDRLEGEVDDLLCMPKPKFLPEVKNPCWWNESGRLLCLPYFHLLGMGKCASTDLWYRMTSHPHIIRPDVENKKEIRWWGKGRYGLSNHPIFPPVEHFPQYTAAFNSLSSKLTTSLQKARSDHTFLISGDGTPSTMIEFRGWPNITQNRGRTLPLVLNPHLMNHIYPNTTKFIIILRNSIDRLYSIYYTLYRGVSARGFHQAVLGAIDIMAKCILNRGLRECFFDDQIFHAMPVGLHIFDYSLFLTEWLKVFPRDRFLFIKTDDYHQDLAGTLRACWNFLGLEPLSDREMNKILKISPKNVNKKKKAQGPMKFETRRILEEILAPSVHFLPEVVGDKRFLWQMETLGGSNVDV